MSANQTTIGVCSKCGRVRDRIHAPAGEACRCDHSPDAWHMAAETTFYTGPLTVAASLGTIGKRDPGAHAVILLGLAHDCNQLPGSPIRVRMEMTPDDAEDTARALLRMAKAAKESPDGKR